jgi:hypothetical protein
MEQKSVLFPPVVQPDSAVVGVAEEAVAQTCPEALETLERETEMGASSTAFRDANRVERGTVAAAFDRDPLDPAEDHHQCVEVVLQKAHQWLVQ